MNLTIAQSLHQSGNLAAAAEAYAAILKATPDDPSAHVGAALIYHQQNQLMRAEHHLRHALTNAPDASLTLAALAAVLLDQGRPEEANDAIAQARALKPGIPEIESNRLLYSLYDPRLSARDRSALHRQWGESRQLPAPSPQLRSDGRIRVAYISADFRNHPVAFFIEPLLRHHDRSSFEIFCYSDVEREDSFTGRLKHLADRWIPTRGLTEAAVADRILADRIDVLVELAGHSSANRLGVLARHPAPALVSYIGYPWTTGLAGLYRFSDDQLDPREAGDSLYTETLLRLPAFWCYQPPADAPAVAAPPSLTGCPFTFGSFNYLGKINARVVEVWSHILLGAPNSRLLLKSKSLDDAGVRENLRSAFAARGVEPARLELAGSTPFDRYMADFAAIDLALDPFPFNGGTTTFHSFYMGVPVIALEGNGHAERMGAALLRHVGLNGFIANNIEDYIRIAVSFAANPQRLGPIRSALRERMERSALMDGAGQSRAIEAAYRQMLGVPESVGAPARSLHLERVLRKAAVEGQASPPFSVVMCGRDPARRARMMQQLDQLLGKNGFELLYVENPPSLAGGYNAGLREASAEIVLLIHDDIEILNADFADRVRKHLDTYDLIGVAGTSRLIDGGWGSAGQPFLFGQVAHPHKSGEGYALCLFGSVGKVFGGIQGMDGLFMAARRSVAQAIRFDEKTFDGFHMYDVDFSFRTHLAGHKLAIANDIHILHHSWGSFDAVWHRYRDRFVQKFAGQLAAPPPKPSHWFSNVHCRTEAELRARMERNASTTRGFSY